MGLPMVTAENYFSPEMNMAYMGSTQFKAFDRCEAAALAEVRGEYAPAASTALLVGGYIDAYFPVSCRCFRPSTRRYSSGTAA